jgi:tripeptide aminopeptidase
MEQSRLDRSAALTLLLQLISVPGRSREEGQILHFIRKTLSVAGVPEESMSFDTCHQRIPGGGEVGNLIVKMPGTTNSPRRLLMAHVDTVPICVGADPVLEGNLIRSRNPESGLGGDNRAGVAVIMTAAIELLRQKLPHPPITIFFAVQEEIGLYGAHYVSVEQLGEPSYCFNWDGGDPEQVCIGATGDFAIAIEIEGIASHAGVHPEQGVSAIAIAAIAIADLTRDGWHGLIAKGTNQGTSNVGIIHAGEATNVVTPRLTLRAEARSHDLAFRRQIVEAYRQAFESAAKAVQSSDGRTGRITFRAEVQYEAFRLPEDSPAVSVAMSAISELGLNPSTRIGNGGLDANWMTAHGLPTVTLGCGQQNIHTTSETLDVARFLQACETALIIASGHEPRSRLFVTMSRRT